MSTYAYCLPDCPWPWPRPAPNPPIICRKDLHDQNFARPRVCSCVNSHICSPFFLRLCIHWLSDGTTFANTCCLPDAAPVFAFFFFLCLCLGLSSSLIVLVCLWAMHPVIDFVFLYLSFFICLCLCPSLCWSQSLGPASSDCQLRQNFWDGCCPPDTARGRGAAPYPPSHIIRTLQRPGLSPQTCISPASDHDGGKVDNIKERWPMAAFI